MTDFSKKQHKLSASTFVTIAILRGIDKVRMQARGEGEPNQKPISIVLVTPLFC